MTLKVKGDFLLKNALKWFTQCWLSHHQVTISLGISAVVNLTSNANEIEMELLLLGKDFRLHYIPKSNSLLKIGVLDPFIDPCSDPFDDKKTTKWR